MLRAVRKTSLETGTAPKRRKNRKSAVHVVSNAQATRDLQIPDSVIDQILKEMKIPEWRWGDAAWDVRSAVQSCVEGFTEGQLGANKSRYRMIASSCNRLSRELSRLNVRERRHFGADLQDFERNLEEIERIAAGIALDWRPRHRPHGSVKYPHIRHLVYDLYVIGELTLSKEVAGAKTKGSLREVLEILHDQLSPEIFPSDIAFNTLKEMRRWAEACLEDQALDYLSRLDDLSDGEEDDRSA